MSAETAHDLETVVATNVRFWRAERGLEQQALADRLAEVGWRTDRSTVARIETVKRKVSVEELGLLAVALNVPLPMLLLPVFEGGDLRLTRNDAVPPVAGWYAWEWMRGAHPLPERIAGGEWRRGASPLWFYENVKRAQELVQEAQRAEHIGAPDAAEKMYDALQYLVETLKEMAESNLPVDDLVADDWWRRIRKLGIEPLARVRARSGRSPE